MSIGDRVHRLLTEGSEGFVFACPGVALSSESVTREWVSSATPHWRLSYRDGTREFVGVGEDVPLAYLDLIKARMDL